MLRLLSEHNSELRHQFGVKSIAVFGSTARNEVGPESDMDVLVEFDPAFEPSLLDFINLKHYLSDTMNVQWILSREVRSSRSCEGSC